MTLPSQSIRSPIPLRQLLVELGMEDEALVGRPPRVAGRQGHQRLARLGLRFVGDREDHSHLRRLHDVLVGDLVRVPGRPGLDDDSVPVAKLVEVGERLAIGGAVPSDREVADLTGKRRLRIVTDTDGQVLQADPLDDRHPVVLPQARNPQDGKGLAPLEGEVELRVRRRPLLPVLLQSVTLGIRGAIGLDVRPHQLVADEQQHYDPSRDEQLAQHPGDASGCAHSTTCA